MHGKSQKKSANGLLRLWLQPQHPVWYFTARLPHDSNDTSSGLWEANAGFTMDISGPCMQQSLLLQHLSMKSWETPQPILTLYKRSVIEHPKNQHIEIPRKPSTSIWKNRRKPSTHKALTNLIKSKLSIPFSGRAKDCPNVAQSLRKDSKSSMVNMVIALPFLGTHEEYFGILWPWESVRVT